MSGVELSPDQIVAERYRIVRLLARGGMGAVYEAEQLATELRVAIKVLAGPVLASPDARKRFELEAKTAARVRSDYIVKMLDAGVDPARGVAYVVMELLEGAALSQVVERSGALQPEQAVAILWQVASGLDRAHGYVDPSGKQRPIVHRDLKPDNLFLAAREDGTPSVKILDFGIAKLVGDTTGDSRDLKGTPLYMAYEQAAGEAISPMTDVWALGLIAFYLLTGKSYWKAAQGPQVSISALFGEVLTLPIVPPSERLAELGRVDALPPAFDDFFLRCVARDPKARFGSASEAIASLAKALDVPIANPPRELPSGDPPRDAVSPTDPTEWAPGASGDGLASDGGRTGARGTFWPAALGFGAAAGLVVVALFLAVGRDAASPEPPVPPATASLPLERDASSDDARTTEGPRDGAPGRATSRATENPTEPDSMPSSSASAKRPNPVPSVRERERRSQRKPAEPRPEPPKPPELLPP